MVEIAFDRSLIEKYDVTGPRYTSYPTVLTFDDRVDAAAYRAFATASNRGAQLKDLSLYFHLPFCARLCYYCACNKIVTKRRDVAARYLARLTRELALHADLYDRARTVTQLHWGGGTPTFLSETEMQTLMAATRRHFALADDATGQFGIEIDPREIRPTTLEVLREIGFNRASLGIQDFEPVVQRAINRVQSEQLTGAVIDTARKLGFRSISVDLIYGLPFQTRVTLARTLTSVIALEPDRVSLYSYAHLPERFPPQRRLSVPQLPGPALKLDLLQQSIEAFTAAGYVYIGMDHFAKPTDELARAQADSTLYRNFQGYSTHADCDLIGMGASAIGCVGGNFYQNSRELTAYDAAIDAGRLPIQHGLVPDSEDRLRRAVIMQLICDFELDYRDFGARFGIDFGVHFAAELARLEPMAGDGLLQLDSERIAVTPTGRLLIRNICMTFDRYLPARTTRPRYSRAI